MGRLRNVEVCLCDLVQQRQLHIEVKKLNKGILRFKFTSCTFVRSIDGIEVLRGEDEKFLSVPL